MARKEQSLRDGDAVDFKTNTIERALQLAATGRFATVTQIKFELKREGYTQVDAHMNGADIHAQLKRIMAGARRSRAQGSS